MALSIIKTNDVREFVPECQIGEEVPTIFGLKPITGADSSAFLAEFMNAKEVKGRGRNSHEEYVGDKLEKQTVKQFCSLVKYVKNFYMPDGDDYKLINYIDKPEDIRYIASHIDPEIRAEVIDASRTIFTLTDGEKKI